MTLRYHQATYDLITGEKFDPQKALDNFKSIEAMYLQECGDPLPVRQKRVEEYRLALKWTELDLYRRPVQFSAQNIARLDALEREHGITLPASVREWYSLDIIPEIMTMRGWAEIALEGLVPLSALEYYRKRDNLPQNLWRFMFDEYVDQGGDYLSFALDISDDPPVLTRYGPVFVQLADTFSTFLYLHFWRWHTEYTFPHQIFLWHHGQVPDWQVKEKYHIPLERLRQHYTPVAGNWNGWLYDDDVRIELHQRKKVLMSGEIVNEEADKLTGGRFYARSIPALQACLERLWGDDIPLLNFLPPWDDSAGEQLLETLIDRRIRQLCAGNPVTVEFLFNSMGLEKPLLSGLLKRRLDALLAEGTLECDPNSPLTLETRVRLRR